MTASPPRVIVFIWDLTSLSGPHKQKSVSRSSTKTELDLHFVRDHILRKCVSLVHLPTGRLQMLSLNMCLTPNFLSFEVNSWWFPIPP